MNERGSLLKRTLAVIQPNFAALIAAAGWPYAIMAVGFLAWGFGLHGYFGSRTDDPSTLWYSLSWESKLTVIGVYLVSGGVLPDLAKAGVTALVSKYLETGRAEMRDAFDGIGKVFWRLVALSVAVLMFVQIGITLFLLPGAVLTLFASLSVIDLVIERPGAMTALMHSFGIPRPPVKSTPYRCLSDHDKRGGKAQPSAFPLFKSPAIASAFIATHAPTIAPNR